MRTKLSRYNPISIMTTVIKNKTKKRGKIPHNGQSIYSFVEISFEESVLGCKKQIDVCKKEECSCTKHSRNTCILCNGKGEITKTTVIDFKIPKGVFDTQTIKLKGKGYKGAYGGMDGDLLIRVHVSPSDSFERRGIDIYSSLKISFPEAVFGTNKVVDTVYGKVNCVIPKGIKSGAKLCLTGKGMIIEETGEIGNHYINIDIDVPKELSQRQTELIRALQDELQ